MNAISCQLLPGMRLNGVAITLLATVVVCALFAPVARAGDPVPLDQAIPVVESFERRLVTVQYEIESVRFRYTPPFDRGKIVHAPDGPGCFYRNSVVLDLPTGRYRCNAQLATQWADGLAPYATGHSQYSFDGQTQRQYFVTRPGVDLPRFDAPDLPKNGRIDRENRDGPFNTFAVSWGVGYFPPFVTSPLKLSEILSQPATGKTATTVTSTGPNQWRVRAAHPSEQNTVLTIDYDTRQGAVTSSELAFEDSGTVYSRAFYDLTEIKTGVWVPRTVDMISIGGSPNGTRRIYRNIKINDPIVDDTVFRIKFPPGTRVEDRIEQKFYKVGSGAESEQTEIREFGEKYKQRLAEWAGQSPPRPWWPWLSGGAVLLIALLIVVALVRRRTRRLAASLLAVVAPLSGLARAAELNADGDWVVSHAPGEEMRISQCGLNVTLFTLEYFQNASYNLKHTVRHLPPTEDGIRLSDIRDVLAGHGFDVAARQKVTPDGLRRALRPDTLAIFPVTITDRLNHYFVLVRDPNRGLLWVDPPRAAEPLDGEWLANHLPDFDGLVLFVRPGAAPLADRVACTPDRLDLGRIVLSDPASSVPLVKELTLTNPTAAPVMVTGVQTSCGCMRCSWPGGLLTAGETRTVPVTIIPNSWGVGPVERVVTFLLGDGSQRTVSWFGEGLAAERAQQLAASPNVLRVDADALAADGRPVEREAQMTLGPVASADRLTVKCDRPWLSARVEGTGEGQARLIVRVAPEAANDDGPATVSLSSGADGEPVRVSVLLQRAVRFLPEPAVLTLTPDGPAAGPVTFRPFAPSDEVTGVEASPAPSGFTAEIRPTPGSAPQLFVAATSAARPGTYRLVCSVTGRVDRPASAVTVVARVEASAQPEGASR
jgi:hypothetical protein